MTARSDYVSIEIEGERLDVWSEYTVDSDLLTPADAFHLTLSLGNGRGQRAQAEFDRIRELCSPLAEVRLYVGADVHGGQRTRALQLTGRIDEVEIDVTRESGATIHLNGRDRAAYLCDSAAPVGLVRALAANATLIDLVRTAVAPWNITVITDQSAARDVLTGAAGLTPEQRLLVEQARVQGIPPARMSAQILRRAQVEGKPLDEATETTVSARSRRESSSGMAPSDVERQRIGEASPHAGETVWAFLARHAERLGVMMWMSPRGELILGSPSYGVPPRARFVRRYINDSADPNNVRSMSVRRNASERFSKVTVLGRGHGRASDSSAPPLESATPTTELVYTPATPPAPDPTPIRGGRRHRIQASAEDPSFPFRRERTEQDADVRTVEHARRQAKRMLREGTLSELLVTVTADDHGQGRYLYAVDTTANVVDEYTGVDETMFCTARTFMRSRGAGTSTRLRYVALNSLKL